ncbi:hypothetical protein QZH41_012549, partial [Actinostola sp. cb2023]
MRLVSSYSAQYREVFVFLAVFFSIQIVIEAVCPPSQLSGLAGNFTSPNFPDFYPGNIECNYVITVPQGYHVVLEFSVIELEDDYNCTVDYILVNVELDAFLYCGKPILPAPYMASIGRNMSVKFVSNGRLTCKGFVAQYTAVPLPVTATPSLIQPTQTLHVTPSSTVLTSLP